MSAGAFIEGERIYLRALSKEDVNGNYVNWLNDAEVCKYNSHHIYPYTKESALSYIDYLAGNRSVLVLAIIERESNTHIGNISLQEIDYLSRTSEFAIILGEKQFWGKGYGKEAAALIIEHGFTALNLNRIYCGTASENYPMQHLAEALGFKQEGLRREAMYKNGKYTDIIEYGILRNEWVDNKIRR